MIPNSGNIYNSENTACQGQSPKSAPSGSKSFDTGRKHAMNVSSSIISMKISSRVQFLQIVGNYRSSSQRIQSAMSQWNVHSFDSNEVLLRQRTERLMLQILSWNHQVNRHSCCGQTNCIEWDKTLLTRDECFPKSGPKFWFQIVGNIMLKVHHSWVTNAGHSH